jgi:zinc transporter 1/2/3
MHLPTNTNATESLVTAITFHQLFEGFSLGVRIASLPAARDGKAAATLLSQDNPSTNLHPKQQRRGGTQLLEVVLAMLFAIATPVGLGVGLRLFRSGGGDVGQ